MRTDGKQTAEVNEALIAEDRHGAKNIKSVKLTDGELDKVSKFQELLSMWINPLTNKPFIPKNEFSALFQFCFNVTWKQMEIVAEEMARAEEVPA